MDGRENEFPGVFDGFSICGTDLTRLALGLSRGGGLVRGEDGLRVNMMAELPGNVFLANIMDMANVSVCATDDVTKCVGALAYYFDPENEECKIAYTRICSSTATSSTAAA